MLVVTTENVVGHRVVVVKGQCFGVVVRSRGLGGNIMAGLRSIVGGEIHEYTHLLEDTRRQAVDAYGTRERERYEEDGESLHSVHTLPATIIEKGARAGSDVNNITSSKRP